MKKIIFSLFVLIFAFNVTAQNSVKGIVVDAVTETPIAQVTVAIAGSNATTQTDAQGAFLLSQDLPEGDQILVVSKDGYESKQFPIVLDGTILDFETITLSVDINQAEEEIAIIALSDNQLSGEDGDIGNVNISGLLTASRDVYFRAAAFDFSAAFFRPRGLDNANGKVLINGLEMNKQFNNRPQWSNWGGINDLQRNQEFTQGLQGNAYTFGGVAGTTNIILRASQYSKGGRVSYAAANRSYAGRAMASYSSGLDENGWAYTFLASRRFGDEGYIDGTLYDANSFLAAVEKRFNDKHSLNLVAMYTPNRRGRSTGITQEIFDLKGRRYNPFWGYQDGEIRNAREREIEEPIFMLNHFWNISESTSINTNIGYQFGTIKNSRIDNSSVQNPSPEYYQNLPSFWLGFDQPNYENAFLFGEQFRNDGQFDWDALYQENAVVRSTGGSAVYALQNDVVEDSQFMANVLVDSKINDNITINGGVNYRSLLSENYAEIEDLLGASGYLDIDNFAVSESQDGREGDGPQSDLNNPNRVVGAGDRYKYNYEIDAQVASAFAQGQFTYNKVDFYLGASYTSTSYQRNGLYENGLFPGERSFGKGEKVDFNDVGLKAGITYKITGRHLLDFNFGTYGQAPGIRNTFSNARQNGDVVIGVDSEQITSFDASYIFRSPFVKARITGYYTGFENGTDVAFYFSENNFTTNGGSFVQEVTTDIERRSAGVEFGVEAQVTPTIKLKAAGSLGQHIFTNNPNLYVGGEDFNDVSNQLPTVNDLGTGVSFGDGTTALKNLHVAGGPERVMQVGFEYRDPDFWWIGATFNHFSNAYIDVSNLARSANFNMAEDGLDFPDYDEATARRLLRQEQIDDYALVNIVGGKSWRVKGYYLGFFATINNVFNQEYITGGFEQSRRVNYQTRLEEANRDTPVFGNRYFFGNGTTYFVNFYVRF